MLKNTPKVWKMRGKRKFQFGAL